jgi:glycosyltransferase involved in cell wall biosynthesis
MLKVAYFSPVSDLKGGAETSLLDLLNNPDVEAVLITPDAGDLSEIATAIGKQSVVVPLGRVAEIRRPVRLANVLPALRDWIKAALTLRKVAALHDFDVVHSNGLKAHFVACLSRVMGGPPVVIHIHDIPLQRRERLLWRMLGIFGDLVLIVSRPCWPSRGELPRNVKVLFNGLDTSRLPVLDQARHPTITIGFCGRLHPYKGVDHLLQWVAHAKLSNYDVRLVIRGEGAPEHHGYLRKLFALVEQLGISSSVTFEGKRQGLQNIYSGLDMVVVPSVVPDALPRSIMEAMGLGLLVVAYPSGGIPDQIQDGIDGFLVSNEQEFLKVIQMTIEDPMAIEHIRSQATLAVQKSFTLDKMYSNLSTYYRSL